MKVLKYLLFITLISLITSCNENFINGIKIKEGVSVNAKMKISVPNADVKDVTRASSDSQIKNLVIVLYRKSNLSETPQVITLTDKLVETEAGYSVGEFEVKSGEYYMYAIANINIADSVDIESIESGLSKDEIESLSFLKNDDNVTMTDNPVLMSSDNDGKTVLISERGTSEIAITLKRAYSKINFKIKTDTEGDQTRSFMPTSYQIYNTALKAPLFKNNIVEREDNDFKDVLSFEFEYNMPDSFSLFVPENIQQPKTNGVIKEWKEREVWDESINTDFIKRTYINAPDDGTYLVINGIYSDKNDYAFISYTIHLGDFSKSLDDYSVERNCSYNYTVNVKGINNIKVDVEENKPSTGQEGVIVVDNQRFEFDAHYENILLNLKVPKSFYGFTFFYKDPYSSGYLIIDEGYVRPSNNEISEKYGWIRFLPNNTNQLQQYPGDPDKITGATNGLLNIFEFVDYLYKNKGKELKFTVYVDEYFYEGKDWRTFINSGNRIFTFSVNEKISANGASVESKPYLSFYQRAIQTVFDNDDCPMPFGIESIDEVGALPWSGGDKGTSSQDGWANTWNNIRNGSSKTSFKYSDYVNITRNGWNDNARMTDPLKNKNGYFACMSRNRPSKKDEFTASDIKWYVPAVNQYLTLWYGETALSEDAKLFDQRWVGNSGITDSNYNQFQLWTSSSSKYRVYWGVEGVAWGTTEHAAPNQRIKCMRNLKNHVDDKSVNPSEVFTYNSSDNIFTLTRLNINAYRSNEQTGEYASGHNERDIANKVPTKFKIADRYLNTKENTSIKKETIHYKQKEVISVENKAWNSVQSGSISGKSKRSRKSNNNYTFYQTVNIPGEISNFFTNDLYKTADYKFGGFYYDTYLNSTKIPFTSGTEFIFNSSSSSANVRVYAKLDSKYYLLTSYDSREETYYQWPNSNYANSSTLIPVYVTSYVNSVEIDYIEYEYDASTVPSINLENIKKEKLCEKYYSESDDLSDLGKWRVPNQKELSVMAMAESIGNAIELKDYTVSSTSFSIGGNLDRTGVFNFTGGNMTIDFPSGKHYIIRCVRDAK